jgi:redox-sensitive bicupin YhaK (pirin superfamily)
MLQRHPRSVKELVGAVPLMEGAGVRVKRTIALPRLDHVDPFLLLDAFDSDDPDEYVAGFPDHPHRGIETVTYMLEGRVRHADSMGNGGVIGPGDAQWMTAGRGIIHSEMPEQEEGLLRGFQLWVNLPSSEKLCAPRYQDVPAGDIPVVEHGSGLIRVISGMIEGARGPITEIVTDPLFLDVGLEAGSALSVPVQPGHAAFVYVFEGGGSVDGTHVPPSTLAVLGDGDRVDLLSGDRPMRLLLVAARPLGEPIARWGPFVMNTQEEIARAIEDYRRGTLATSPA